MAKQNVVEMEEHTRQKFEDLVLRHFGPQILTNVKVYLACAMQTSLVCDQPTAVILVGPSSSGKTLATRFIDAEALSSRFYRTDEFTPASFVSQIANKSEEQLRKVDMLPKIRDKCMITPELAPLFKDDRKQMLKNFGIITRVMDGEGYLRDSGTHGRRGYTGDYNFAWIGGTTPLPASTFRLMGQLGNRLLFYNTEGEKRLTVQETIERAKQIARKKDSREVILQCRDACTKHLKLLFELFPIRTVTEEWFDIPEELENRLAQLAVLLTYLRASVDIDDFYGQLEFSTPNREDPARVIKLFKNLVFGYALINGRQNITEEDIAMIRHITLSSTTERRRRLFRALLEQEEMGLKDVKHAILVSDNTAYNRMEELAHLEVANYSGGQLTIREAFRGL